MKIYSQESWIWSGWSWDSWTSVYWENTIKRSNWWRTSRRESAWRCSGWNGMWLVMLYTWTVATFWRRYSDWRMDSWCRLRRLEIYICARTRCRISLAAPRASDKSATWCLLLWVFGSIWKYLVGYWFGLEIFFWGGGEDRIVSGELNSDLTCNFVEY